MNDTNKRSRGGLNLYELIPLIVSSEIAKLGQITGFDSNGSSKGFWFDPDVRDYFSSGDLNVRLRN